MTDTKLLTKWFCRGSLALLLIGLSYVALQPHYNIAHWIPHRFIRDLGLSYSRMLWLEQHADVALHFLGAWGLSMLAWYSRFRLLIVKPWTIWLAMGFCLIMAEIIQYQIGRGADFGDLLFGTLGCFMAYFTIKRINSKLDLNW